MNTRMEGAGEKISDLEDETVDNNEAEQKKEELYNTRIDLGNSMTPSKVIIFVSWESQKKKERA